MHSFGLHFSFVIYIQLLDSVNENWKFGTARHVNLFLISVTLP